MAKVTGPLYSMGASGKIANAMVFFPWKGNNVVRQWLKPSNPKTNAQGDARMILGGAGRAASIADVNEDFVGQINTLGLIPGGQTKQSYIVKKLIDLYGTDIATFETNYDEYDGHAHQAAFDGAAALIPLNTVDVSYKTGVKTFTGGLMLYLLAKLALNLSFTGAPYTTALAEWDTTQVNAMVVDLIGE